MIVQCPTCRTYYDDTYRWTICPHDPFLANDGNNNFSTHPESYLSLVRPTATYDDLLDFLESTTKGGVN